MSECVFYRIIKLVDASKFYEEFPNQNQTNINLIDIVDVSYMLYLYFSQKFEIWTQIVLF